MAVGYIRTLEGFFRDSDKYYEIWFSKLSIFPAGFRNGYIHNTIFQLAKLNYRAKLPFRAALNTFSENLGATFKTECRTYKLSLGN
jgi:hypothetical protein